MRYVHSSSDVPYPREYRDGWCPGLIPGPSGDKSVVLSTTLLWSKILKNILLSIILLYAVQAPIEWLGLS